MAARSTPTRPAGERLTTTALNRALLARQGLLQRLGLPLVDAVEAIGAIQAQHWPAVAVALWARVDGVDVADLHRAFEARELVAGTLLRGTLHVVAARQHPAYAAVMEASGVVDWRRTPAAPPPEMDRLWADLHAYVEEAPRSGDDLYAFLEDWVGRHRPAIDEAELAHQRQYRWRPLLRSTRLARVPGNGRWDDPLGPRAVCGAPAANAPRPPADTALEDVVRSHLGAFGPAGPDDVASWLGMRTPPVRAAFEQLGPELVQLQDEAGRTLYDLPDAPRPDPTTTAPVRLLPWFDTALLAYAPARRARILPDAYRDLVYVRANLQWKPTFLVDGLVAGTWSLAGSGRAATLELKPFVRLARPARAELLDEAERLVRFARPNARDHRVAVEED